MSQEATRCGKAIQAILRKRYIENTEEERTFNDYIMNTSSLSAPIV